MNLDLSRGLLDSGLVPDAAIRAGIRRLIAGRVRQERQRGPADPAARIARWIEDQRGQPVAVEPAAANRQHYEVPAEFFAAVLGPRLKYSCALWDSPDTTLAGAEEAMLALTTRRAEIEDGQAILDLGCGWGSLSFYLAERFPACSILAVSNSHSQGAFITAEAARRGLANLRHQVADVNRFVTTERFHRIVSVEMMEHVRNHAELFHRLAAWLHPGGGLFVHVFCHRDLTYPFDDGGPGDWMARHFFTGGMMPAADLLPACGGPFALDARYEVCGMHYARTAAAWLARLDVARDRVLPLFEHTYGRGRGRRWIERWRIFFMACAELFAAGNGSDWFVSHYRFVLPPPAANRRRPAGFRVVRGAGAARWQSPTPS
jgi:cyclopropane-fatty-acyl-phospholipid synthase